MVTTMTPTSPPAPSIPFIDWSSPVVALVVTVATCLVGVGVTIWIARKQGSDSARSGAELQGSVNEILDVVKNISAERTEVAMVDRSQPRADTAARADGSCDLSVPAGSVTRMHGEDPGLPPRQRIVRRLREAQANSGWVVVRDLVADVPDVELKSVISDLYLLRFRRVISWPDTTLGPSSCIRVLKPVRLAD